MPWYKTGTVKTTINSNAIIGTGTAFISNSRVGDAFRGPDGNWYEVVNIASDTAMSISPNYQGSTVAAGTYSLAPMQGYVKESADRLRQIVDQWGATLAGLGSVSTENVVPVAKGGTGATTAAVARTNLGLGSAATYAAVGTGGIIERGSNSNGQFTKFADGTLICWGSLTGYTAGVTSNGTFALSFVGIPSISCSVQPVYNYDYNWMCYAGSGSVWTFRSENTSPSNKVSMIAVGRWN